VTVTECKRKDRSFSLARITYTSDIDTSREPNMNKSMNSRVRLHFHQPGAARASAISYAIGQCRYGALLVAKDASAICAIFIADHAADLRAQLEKAFPATWLIDNPLALGRELSQVCQFVDEPGAMIRLDLSVGGTPFQQRVWTALAHIPAGSTRSYTELAADIGAPDAVRAVASACAANLLAVAIPCHRVLRSDGSISGYRWGPQVKENLLIREHRT
jgi:AraC family transcriptional regulator of adaptative response/methylated-DNA-[protein]-cysteine methyltransferase